MLLLQSFERFDFCFEVVAKTFLVGYAAGLADFHRRPAGNRVDPLVDRAHAAASQLAGQCDTS